MKRVKPNQTPERPITEGAYSRNTDDIAPTTIYCKTKKLSKDNKEKRIQLSFAAPNSSGFLSSSLPWHELHMQNLKHHNGDHRKHKLKKSKVD